MLGRPDTIKETRASAEKKGTGGGYTTYNTLNLSAECSSGNVNDSQGEIKTRLVVITASQLVITAS